MSRFPTPRGTARAIRRGNTAPSVGYIVLSTEPDDDLFGGFSDADIAQMQREDADRQRYRDLRDEGYSHHQAMLMSGRGDPDSLGCS